MIRKVVSFVKLLEYVAAMMFMNTHSKGVLDFRGVFDPAFLLIVVIWNDVQNGSVSTLSSIYFQTFLVSPSSSDHVDLWNNLRCNNPKETFFLENFLSDFEFSFIFTKNSCFICAMCGDVTEFYMSSPNKSVKTLYKKGRYVPNSLT